MPCRAMKERIHAYIDCELSAEERLRVERHAADCPRCADYLDQMTATREALRGAEPLHAPDVLYFLLNAKVRFDFAVERNRIFPTFQIRPPRAGWQVWFRALAAALPATAILLVISFALCYRPASMEPGLSSGFFATESGVSEPWGDNGSNVFVNAAGKANWLSSGSLRRFAGRDFPSMGEDHLGVLTRVRSDGRIQVEAMSRGDETVRRQLNWVLNSGVAIPAEINGVKVDSLLILTFEKVVVDGGSPL